MRIVHLVSEQRAEPELILYGGAFDPPHEGHRLLVENVLRRFANAQLFMVPGQVPAGASGQHKQPKANFEQRLEMCRLLVASLAPDLRDRIVLSPIEARLAVPNYTLRTLEALGDEFPGKTWALLMGRDQLHRFKDWHRPKAIIERATLLVIDREQSGDEAALVTKLAQDLGLNPLPVGPMEWRWRDQDTGIYWLAGCVSTAASQHIRNDVKGAVLKGWLLPEVANYIQSAGLYQEGEA